MNATIRVIAPWYGYYPILCDALRLQTYAHWTLDLVHDGPEIRPHTGAWRADPRITIRHTERRYNDWGHSLRAEALTAERLAAAGRMPDYVVVTNADNYYAPPFLEAMLLMAAGRSGAYCDCVHSHYGWRLLPAALTLNHIDCGSLLVETDLAIAVGWPGRQFAADWQWIAALLAKGGQFVHVAHPYFVHN